MRKYLRLYVTFIKVGFIADLEYRANFIFRVVTDMIWYFAQVLSFTVIFAHTPTIGGWNLEQTRVFLGVLFVVDAFYMIMLNENLDNMTERVRKGSLDLLLAKPVNSQFMTSLQKVSTSLIANLLIAIGFLIWSIHHLPDPNWNSWRILWLLVLIPCGLISLYTMRFFIATLAVIYTKSDNLQFLWYNFYRLGLRPDAIYPRWLRFLLMSLIPVALIGSVPSRFVLLEPDWSLLAWTIGWTAISLYGSHRFWNFALKHYSSASS